MSSLKRLIGEIHHRSLWQVLLIYVGAAWACFELIDTVTDRLGLPAWLPGLGGTLDVVDSILWTAPIGYACWMLWLGR